MHLLALQDCSYNKRNVKLYKVCLPISDNNPNKMRKRKKSHCIMYKGLKQMIFNSFFNPVARCD